MEVIPRTALFNFHLQRHLASENVVDLIKKGVSRIAHFFYSSRKTILLILVVVLVTLVFSYFIAPFVNDDANNNAGNGADEISDRTLPTTGTIYVSGLEIYGGDTKSRSGNVYIDWAELTLGSSKSASFYVRSTGNADVELGLNVTKWTPSGIGDYLNISWDYDGTLLGSGPNQVPLLVTINLAVSSSGEFIDFILENKVTSFSFDMTIYASGA